MRTLVVTLLLLFSAKSISAQVVTNGNQLIGWDQGGISLAIVQSYVYPATIDNLPSVILNNVVCIGPGPYFCKATFPSGISDGIHAITLKAVDGTLASLPSTPLNFRMATTAPSAPTGLRITPTQ